jgi:SPP1 family predicted phage head-tail adaptor
MTNAGKYNKKINIYATVMVTDSDGFQNRQRTLVLSPYASVKTTKGFTIIKNNSDFEKAYTNFTIRYPITPINRDMEIEFNGKKYTIEYLNNVDEKNVELEMQCKEVTH